MENKKKQIASVEIEGKEYRLAYDFNAIAQVEAESGGNLLLGLTNLANLSATQLRGLLCAAFRAADPKSKITAEQVSGLLNYGTIFPFSEALAHSILLSLPKKPKGDVAKPPVADPLAADTTSDKDETECL